MYEEDEGNGRLMPRKAGTHPLIWAQSAGEQESVQHPEGAFEVRIVVEAPATNHLLAAQTEHWPNTHTQTHTYRHIHAEVHAYLQPDTNELDVILRTEKWK